MYVCCLPGARELARDARATTPDDPMNSVVGGLASGAVLGLIQGWLLDQKPSFILESFPDQVLQ